MPFDFTTASRADLDIVWRSIGQAIGDDRFFTTKELDYLPQMLDPYEQVLAFSSGFHRGNTWLIALTNERIILLDKGMIYGVKTSIIELDRINNVEYQKGIIFGRIIIGSNAGVYEIDQVWKKTIEPFVRSLRDAIKARRRGILLLSPGTEETPSIDEDDDVGMMIDGPAGSNAPIAGAQSAPAPIGIRKQARCERLRRAGLLQ